MKRDPLPNSQHTAAASGVAKLGFCMVLAQLRQQGSRNKRPTGGPETGTPADLRTSRTRTTIQ